MHRRCGSMMFVAAGLFMAAPSHAANLIRNGDFFQGLDGWSSYAAGGDGGAPSAAFFDVTGDRAAEPAARFQAGTNTLFASGGGGLYQQFLLPDASQVTFSAAIAAYNDYFMDNADGGTLSVIVDGQQYATYSFADIDRRQVLRGSLNFTADLASGAHELRLEATRRYMNSADTPYQFFTNVALNTSLRTVSAAPEPTSWLLMIAGTGLAGGALRRRRRTGLRPV